MAYRKRAGLGVDPATATAVITAGKSIWDAFGQEQTGASNMEPLPYTVDQFARVLRSDPELSQRLRSHLQPYSSYFGEYFLGRPVTSQDWNDPTTLSRIALFHATAPGRDVNIEEEQTRRMIQDAMESRQIGIPGTDVSVPRPTPDVTRAGGTGLAILAALGLVWWLGTQGT